MSDSALYASIALVLARAMMLEILREPIQIEVAQQPIPRGPGPAAGLVLDLLCCIPALLVLLRGALDRSFAIYRSLANVVMLLLGVWTIASACWASDKFAAAVSASHFAAGLVVLWTFSQVVRDWRGLRLVAGAAFALLLVLTAQGLIYKFVDLPELHRSVERDWAQILAERGWEPNSFIANQFKKRIMGGEVMGFSASPNTLGALLVMLGVVSVGLLLQRIRDRDEYGLALVLGLSLLPAAWVIWFTGSRTALATPILAAILLIVSWNARSWIVSHRKLAFWASVFVFLLCTGAVVTHGIRNGSLFHDSLTFRWKYWIGAWRIFVAHPIAGVGFANFGLYYLGMRLPEAAEEIHDPHNFIVRIFVELGLIGGSMLLLWTLRLWWEMTRPVAPMDTRDDKKAPATRVNPLAPLVWISAGATAIAIAAAVDFSQRWEYGFIEVLKRLLYAALLLVGLVVGTIRSTAHAAVDERPAAGVLYAILAGIAVFLLHNLVDFSLFENGAMFLFAMLSGTVLGIRLSGETAAMPRGQTVTFALASFAATIAFALAIVAPVVAAEREARLADHKLRRGVAASAATGFQRAFNSLWIPNADYAFRAARAMVLAGGNPDDIRAVIHAANRASPTSVQYARLGAEFEMKLPRPDPQAAITAFQRVVELDPSDVSTRVDFAKMLERFGRTELDLFAVVEVDRVSRAVQIRDTLPRSHFDVVLLKPPWLARPQIGSRNRAAEKVFAERGTMVRAIHLLPDHQKGPFAVALPDRFGRRAPAQPGANQQIFHVTSAHAFNPAPL